MVYELLSAVGGLGLLAQTVLGFAHGGHSGHGGHAGDSGGVHLHGHVHLPSHALENVHAHGHLHGAPQTTHGGNHASPDHPISGDVRPSPLAPLYSLLSPLALFTICLGAGVTGLLLEMQVHERLLVALGAACGGFGLYYLVVKPVWVLIFRFASKPAATLSAAVAQEGEADSRFDPQGKGIVRLDVDGQIVRILGQLEPEDMKTGVPVTTGQKLVITAIDRQRNTCRVTRL